MMYEHILLGKANKPENTGCHTQQEESSKLSLEVTLKNIFFLTEIIELLLLFLLKH